MLGHGAHWISEQVRTTQQHEQQGEQEQQPHQVRQHRCERDLVGRLDGDLDVVVAQVLLGRAHRRLFFDGPGLPAGGIGQQDALTADGRAHDVTVVDAVEHVADRRAGLVPDGIRARVRDQPQPSKEQHRDERERGHDHALAAQAGWDGKTAEESFHLVPQPLFLIGDWLVR
jgi:hypothetical protein